MIIKCLDYIYYRVTKLYMKWDGEVGVTGIITVTLIISMLFIDLYGVIHLVFIYDSYGNQFKDLAKIIGTASMILIFIFNYLRYRKRYNFLKKKWAGETQNERFYRGLLVIFAIIIPILLPILYLTIYK